MEKEFATTLYHLANEMRGKPIERAFKDAAEKMSATKSGEFFKAVSVNLDFGMSYKEALFDPDLGVMKKTKSGMINSSMRILVEAAERSSEVAAETLYSISKYIDNIHKVNDKLRDYLTDILSDIKSQIGLLTPAIAGVVIGITSMITFILGALQKNMDNLSSLEGGAAMMNVTTLFGDGLPTYFFQIVVGVYVVEIIYILTVMRTGIENGADTVREEYSIGQNLMKAPMKYSAIALIVMLIFNLIAATIIQKTLAT
ncbi:hypothetical protein ACFLZN_01185 [Nanoarchaeota archaeon]